MQSGMFHFSPLVFCSLFNEWVSMVCRVFKNICLHVDHKKQSGSGARSGPDNKLTRLTLGFLGVKTFFESLQILRNAVDSFHSDVFQKFKDTMDQARGGELLELFGSLFSENLTTQKAAFMSRSQQIFALKSGHPLLDVYRKTFCDATEAVHDLANLCKIQHPRDFANLSVRYAEQRGFFFHVPFPHGSTNLDLENHQGGGRNALPQGFVVLVNQGKAIQCTCDELNALNMRIATAAKDCITITETVLDDKCEYIVENFLSKLVSMYDAISEIDMLASFALLATQKQGYCRPVVTTYGPFVIQDGRHPMMEERIEEYQSNDTWMCEDSTVQVITGPNLAGKSTFLKQNGLLVLMAQCGCFVPASFMCLTPFKNIIMLKDGLHLGTTGISSSTHHTMKQISHAIQHASKQSLVLADEICNTSSSLYDTALCWAIAEEFLICQCKTLIATHATQLCSLSQLYPQCRCFTLSARNTTEGDNEIEYTRKLRRGRPHESERYGIALAEKLGFPPDVIEVAKNTASILEQQISKRVLVQSLPGLHQETVAFGISSQVACIKEMFSCGDFTPEDVFESLLKIRTAS